MDQLDAAIDGGAASVIADFQDPRLYGEAVRAARAGGAEISLASPRIHQPGESETLDLLADARPDGILARNLAALAFSRRMGLPAVADFSLNAVNDLSVEWLHVQGAVRVTAAYDLDGRRLLELASAVPPEWLEVVVHRHAPLFHSAYCLFCGLLSQGRNKADCGLPCRRFAARLRDRLGVEHPLLADGQCRNTLFHAEAENLAGMTPSLRACGIRHFRVELLLESRREDVRHAMRTFDRYRAE